MGAGRTLLIVSQVYVPDPASVGQHVADAAAAMVRRGWRVVVLTSARGYDEPSRRYPARETRDGVEVRRLPLASFGKRSLPIRLFGAASFLLQALLRGLCVRGLRGVLVSTSPPMAPAAVLPLAFLRRVPFAWWVMDINPDQAIALGKVRAGALSVRLFDRWNRRVLRRARAVIALDRFMAERVRAKHDVGERMAVLPPWPHEEPQPDLAHADNPFRAAHGLQGRFVFMYSGNHGPSHPIATILQAAKRLEDRADIVFLFVGGGIGKREVEDAIAAGARNVRSLPYQPLADLRFSLSAADVHLVTFGEPMVGIVHPCKVYGAMALCRPVLLVGPERCHVGDLIREHRAGWRVAHGAVEELEQLCRAIADAPRAELAAMGVRGQDAVRAKLSKSRLCAAFCDVLEGAL
jgi:glycosyltransferase involved in cell wall biosynthesis